VLGWQLAQRARRIECGGEDDNNVDLTRLTGAELNRHLATLGS
jgi:hypothetical protein